MISANRKRGTVVVIEDDEDTSEIIALAVAMEGHSVHVAREHTEAIELITLTDPDMILLDYYGVTSDIQALINAIDAIQPYAPIVLMTGAKQPAEKARELGLREHLAKPFNTEDLRSLLRIHCKSSRSGRPSQRKLAFNIF
jgi:DNA-binding NtrC family response regulator